MIRSAPLSVALCFLVAALFTGCGTGQSHHGRLGTSDSLTERQRDSMLSTSGIPGAHGVGAAMRAADATNAAIHAAESAGP
jgi:hypothetical protein